MSNSKTRDLIMEVGPQIPDIAQRAGVNIVAGPYVNREHLTVVIVEAETADKVDQFLLDARLPQWNEVRVVPSKPIEEGMQEIQQQKMVF